MLGAEPITFGASAAQVVAETPAERDWVGDDVGVAGEQTAEETRQLRLFREYLQGIYGDIEKLNISWRTVHDSFDDIAWTPRAKSITGGVPGRTPTTAACTTTSVPRCTAY